MNTLEKLRDEVSAYAKSPYADSRTAKRYTEWADTLDAYIKAQESAEPVVGYGLRKGGSMIGYRPIDWAFDSWERRECEIVPLYTAPPPREPISQESIYLAAKKLELTHLALEFGGLLSELGIEVKP